MIVEQNIQYAEAIIFASGDGVSYEHLKNTLDVDEKQLDYILSALKSKYDGAVSGVVLVQNSDSISFTTNVSCGDMVYKALTVKKNTPLSNAAMETLAIIAYNQPVSRAFIEQVRGVDSTSSVQTLVTRGLVEEAGRLDIPGKPISYKTTPLFLRSFSLDSLRDLPKIKSEKQEGQISAEDIVNRDSEYDGDI